MTALQKTIRHHRFRALCAHYDAVACAKGRGPWVLTWREARAIWRGATIASLLLTQNASQNATEAR